MNELGGDIEKSAMEVSNALSASITNYFLKSCATAYYCNLADESVQIIQDADIKDTIPAGKFLNFKTALAYYVKKFVHPDDRAEMLEKLSVEYARKSLKRHESYDFSYREKYRGKESTYRGIVIRGEDADHVILCFWNISDEFRNEMEQAEIATAHRALVENNSRVMALEDNFESLYDVDLETGEYDLYIKGQTFQEEVNTKFVPHSEFFADLQSDIDIVVYEEDRENVSKVLTKKNLRKVLKKENHFDLYYRLMINDTPMWFRLRAVYKNAEKRHVILGVFHAEDEMREKQREQKLRDELINQMIGDDGLFLIDCVKDTRKTIHDHCYGAANYSDEDEYSASITKYIDTFVAEPDRAMMRAATSPENMLARVNKDSEYSIEYRDFTTGSQCFYEMRIAKFSDTEVLQSFVGRDKEILDRLMFKKMEDEYFALFVVDIDTEEVRVVRNNSWFRVGDAGKAVHYASAMRQFADSLDPEPQAFFSQLADLDNVKKELETEDKHTYSYKSSMSGENNWIDVTSFVILRHDDGTPALFTIGFSVADSLRAGRQEVQSRLKEDMQMIGGLASGYHALYYFNIDENIFKIYSIDGKRVNELKHLVSEDGDPLEMIVKFGLSNLVHPDDRWLFETINVETVRERLAHTKKYTVRFRRNVDGEYMWTEMDIIKYEDIDVQANVIAIGFAVRDAEIRKEQEQQRLLEEARAAAEAASKSKTSFLFNMSHDIRTPMNAITGFTAMAKKNADDRKKVMEYLDKIDISGQQLLMLINQVLEMARIESGKIELEEKPVNVLEQFNSMVTMLTEQASINGLTFNHSLSDIRHYKVLADEARMGSITLNIVGNAMKYTPEGGSVDFSLRELDCEREGYARFVFTVADTGIGMSEEYMKVLFEPFSREKSSTVSKIQGTGLGMSIVKNLVDVMGGKINVQSKPGQGSKFEITLELRIDNEERPSVAKLPDYVSTSFAGHRILLVEDNEMNREIAKSILEETGLIVDEAKDGDVAVSIVKGLVEKKALNYYDVILMDVQMPRMNGYMATKAIREILEGERHIPIIAMTANAFEKDRQDAIDAGMDEHLTKPIDFKMCIQTLSKYIH